MTVMEYTGPYRGLTRVAGHPYTARRPTPGADYIIEHGPDAPIEYTTPTPSTRLQRVAGHPARRPTPAVDVDDTYSKAQRRHDARKYQLTHPDHRCYGIAAPYNIVLPGGRDDWLVFDEATEWRHAATVPLQVEHTTKLLGYVTPVSEPHGLVAVGLIYNPLHQFTGDRRQLSIASTTSPDPADPTAASSSAPPD